MTGTSATTAIVCQCPGISGPCFKSSRITFESTCCRWGNTSQYYSFFSIETTWWRLRWAISTGWRNWLSSHGGGYSFAHAVWNITLVQQYGILLNSSNSRFLHIFANSMMVALLGRVVVTNCLLPNIFRWSIRYNNVFKFSLTVTFLRKPAVTSNI